MRADGTEFPVELVVTRPEIPGAPVFYGYLRDLTARYVAEASLHRLADEQAALRRVATAVAAEHDPTRLFALVSEEVGRLLEARTAHMFRFDADGAGGDDHRRLGAAARARAAGRHAHDAGRRHRRRRACGAPGARRAMDTYEGAEGELAATMRGVRRAGRRRGADLPRRVAVGRGGRLLDGPRAVPGGRRAADRLLRRAGRAGAGQRPGAGGARGVARPHRRRGRRRAPAAGAQPARRRAAAARVARR